MVSYSQGSFTGPLCSSEPNFTRCALMRAARAVLPCAGWSRAPHHSLMDGPSALHMDFNGNWKGTSTLLSTSVMRS